MADLNKLGDYRESAEMADLYKRGGYGKEVTLLPEYSSHTHIEIGDGAYVKAPLDEKGYSILPGDIMCYFMEGTKYKVVGIGDGCFYYVYHDEDHMLANTDTIFCNDEPSRLIHFDDGEEKHAVLDRAKGQLVSAIETLISVDDPNATALILDEVKACFQGGLENDV